MSTRSCSRSVRRREAYEKLVFSYPSFREYLESVAKLRLRSKQARGAIGLEAKEATLDRMFESLNPTKRKLIAKELRGRKAEQGALRATYARPDRLG